MGGNRGTKKIARKFIIILLIPYLVLKNFAALVCAVLLDLLMHTYFNFLKIREFSSELLMVTKSP